MIYVILRAVHWMVSQEPCVPLRALLSTAVNISALSAALITKSKPPWGEKGTPATCRKYNEEAEKDHIRQSLGMWGPGWMLGGQHETLLSCLLEQLCSITCCANSFCVCLFFPLKHRADAVLWDCSGLQQTSLGCASGLNLTFCDTLVVAGKQLKKKQPKAFAT